MSEPCRFPAFALKQGAFAPPELPGFTATTPQSVIRHGRACLSRASRCSAASRAPSRTSLVAQSISPMRAATTTPVESADAYLARFSADAGLPRHCGESASMTTFRGLLGVHSRCGMACGSPSRPFQEVLQPIRYLLDRSLYFRPEREVAGSDLHRRINRAFATHTQQLGRGSDSSDRAGALELAVRWIAARGQARRCGHEPHSIGPA